MNRFYSIAGTYRNYIFLFLLLAVYLFSDFQTILFLRPQGIHFIRQTDCLSFVANYYKNGFDFFNPRVFNLISTDGRAACEFPILYYITAALYLLFHEKEFILRLLSVLIVSTGFFFLFKTLFSLLQDIVYSMAFCFLFLSSAILLYYTNNFLPDAGAFGLTLTGWYFFFVFMKDRARVKIFFAAILLFTTASLIKVTYFIYPVAAVLTILTHDISGKTGIIATFQKNFTPVLFFIVSFLAILSWNLYVIYYNKLNHDNYFLIQAQPFWSQSKQQIIETFDLIGNYWYSKYYYHSTWHFFVIVTIAGLIFIRKSEKLLLILTLFLTAGCACYFLLFFAQFRDHDYYFITFIPFIIFSVIHSFTVLKNRFPRVTGHTVSKILLVILCILSINYAKQKLSQRYQDKNVKFAMIGQKMSGMQHYLDSTGMPVGAKVIIVTDTTPNGGLYFINRSGWNISDTSETGAKKFASYIKQGAEYVLFTGNVCFDKYFNGVKTGEYNSVSVYRIIKK